MGMLLCNDANTPIANDNLIDLNTNKLCTDIDSVKYCSVVGALLHIARMTCPDIQYAMNKLSRMVHNPSQNSMLALKHLI